jgi:Curlin associated repeat
MKFFAYCFVAFLLAGLGSCQRAHAANYVQENVASVAPYGPVSSPGGEQYFNITDGNIGTKYLNFNKINVGFTVRLVAPTIIRELALTTANDASERDPMTIAVYGSNTQGQLGTLIVNNLATNLSTSRYATSNVTFDNSTSYTYYTIVYLTLRNYGAANSVQLAEARFLYDTQYNPAPPAYASSITAAQQNRVNAAAVTRAGIMQNGIYIDQVGNNNTVNINQVGGYNQVSGIGTTYAPVRGDLNTITIRQGDPGNPAGKNLIEMSVQGTGSNTLNLNQGRDTTGNYTGTDVGNHYQYINVSGYSNTVATNQQNAGGTVGHYLEANIIGNYNTVGLIQTGGTTQKQTFATVNGNNNTLNASQTGLGNHYLDVSLMGNGNSAIVNQYGNTANAATISLTNAGGPASVNLTQTGGQVYNISTVCVTVGGCAPITVRQGN